MTVTDLTPEERVRRVKAALAEAGYPDAEVRWAHEQVSGQASIPHEVWYRACAVTGQAKRCWDCFMAAPFTPSELAPPCDHDPMTSPWPEVVR